MSYQERMPYRSYIEIMRFCEFDHDLFAKHLNFKSAMPKEQTILEIKYDRFLFKQIQDVLSKCDLSKKPPSKFGTSRQILKEYYPQCTHRKG